MIEPRKSLVPNPRPAAHGCNVCQLADGRLWLMWFAGSHEGNEDQRVLMSIGDPPRNGGHVDLWSMPRVLVDHLAHEDDRWVPEVAAPLVVGDQAWVAYSASPTASFSFRTDRDTYVRDLLKARLFLAPTQIDDWQLGASTQLSARDHLVLQGKALELADGSWLLQCNSHDGPGRHSASLLLGAPGAEWEQVRELEADPGCLEAATAQLSDGQLICYLRNAGYGGHLWYCESSGAVADLSRPRPTALRNPHSGVDLAVDADDRWLVCFNDSYRLRTPLTLGISIDGGASYRCRDLETDNGEYSYPKLLQTEDGGWHVFYTYRRECIACVSFDPDWLLAGRPVYGFAPG